MNIQLVVVLVSLLVVIVTSLFKVVDFSTKVKQAIAFGVSTVAGAVTAYATGQFDNVTDVASTVLVIYGLAQAIYQFLFDQGRVLSGVDNTLEDIRLGSGDAGA